MTLICSRNSKSSDTIKLVQAQSTEVSNARSRGASPVRHSEQYSQGLHESADPYVIVNVRGHLSWVIGILLPLCASAADVTKVLKDIEKRYNGVKTLQVSFEETYKAQGRSRTESGDLYLRKPGRMRWEYSKPAGKLFVSDGKNVYFYSPESNRAEKMKLKETEDMRAPMAFLLGRLDFDRDFGEYQSRAEGANLFITAIPKSDKMPYRQVSFVVSPDARIERLIVAGQDASTLEFAFYRESVNPPINDKMFQFQVPNGAEFIDSSATQGAQ